jgi:hypothetical protein
MGYIAPLKCDNIAAAGRRGGFNAAPALTLTDEGTIDRGW